MAGGEDPVGHMSTKNYETPVCNVKASLLKRETKDWSATLTVCKNAAFNDDIEKKTTYFLRM